LKYKPRTPSTNAFGAFQVILSNGVSSPVFTANNQNDQGLQSFAIPDYSVVKRVKGTQQGGDSSYWLSKLSFGNKDGTEITKVELSNNKPYGPDFVLDDSEEIIGIYGTQNKNDYIYQLGFIVWKPPRI
jgi:hypothetical protein